MKNIDTETRDNTVADDVATGDDAVAERGVKLLRPVERGGEKITYVEITGAIEQAGSLRGLSLTDVLNLKTDAMFTLLPRVTSPRLDEVTLKKMSSRDFIQLCAVAVNFMSEPDSGGKSAQETAA
ncbi:phage tail protein [Escherichia coli]|uniref:phage tail protein n=1 Tax=Escherichia coli TaxID=562 RepID=UPI001BD5F643|nr:phage tail protein [Escherichia coli]MBS9582022.1 phage tail protein [Escherichia coli]